MAAVYLAVLAAGFLFAYLNDGTVTLDYLAGRAELRLAIVVFGGVAVGCLVGLGGGFAAYLQQRREIQRLRSRIVQLESELASLRAAASRSVD
jgi:uncharacterized integral membrane protein